jgi:hypothetical protein
MHSDRPEHEILFCVARREPDRARLRPLLSQVQDWDHLFALASYHGLVPLLHKHVHESCTEVVPVNFLSRLKQYALANSQNVLHLLSKQLKVYRLLRDRGVPVAVFKGSLLSQMSYGEIALRQAGDIDLLIDRQDFGRARALLEWLGYEMTPRLTSAQLASHLNHHCEIQFVRDDWFTVVDLHWELAPKSFVFNVETDEVMSRLQTVAVAGAELQTLATEDLILYLSMHGAKHLWRALEWISSLGELIRSTESIDWDVVIERAGKIHATRMLGLALHLVERVSGPGIVSHALGAFDQDETRRRVTKLTSERAESTSERAWSASEKAWSAGRMADEVLEQMFIASGPADSTETNLYNLKIMDRKRDVLVSALRAIFVPTFTDWNALTLPASLHSLYYAYRPLRLSKIYTTALWRKLNSRGAA